MTTLFKTPFRQAISPLDDKIRRKLNGISCAELQAKGIRKCIEETIAIIDLTLPTIGEELVYSDGGSSGPYSIVLASANVKGSHELLDFRPTNHFLRLPAAILDDTKKTISFPITVEQGQTKADVLEAAMKELNFVNFYLQNLTTEWEGWYDSVVEGITKFLTEKDSTCAAKSNFIDSLNN